jgi:hypothetical protein
LEAWSIFRAKVELPAGAYRKDRNSKNFRRAMQRDERVEEAAKKSVP